jgi:hypothetical protein
MKIDTKHSIDSAENRMTIEHNGLYGKVRTEPSSGWSDVTITVEGKSRASGDWFPIFQVKVQPTRDFGTVARLRLFLCDEYGVSESNIREMGCSVYKLDD